MKIYQKYQSLVIAIVSLIYLLSSSSAQIIKKRSHNVFQQASLRLDKIQSTPLEIRFRDDQMVSVTAFFEEYRKVFPWSENNEAILFQEFRDNLGQTHHRFKQYYKGVELAEVQYLLHEKEGYVTYAHGKLIHSLNMDVKPVLSEDNALKKALDHINAASYMWDNKKYEAILKKEWNDRSATFFPRGELMISSGLKDKVAKNFRLVYRFDVFSEIPLNRCYIDVDARTGEIVGVLPRLYNDDVQGYGTTLYNGDVDIIVSDSDFYIPPNPSPHFHLDDWQAYGDSGNSWWVADTSLGNQGGYSDTWYEVLETDPVILDGENLTLSFNHRYAVELPSIYEEYDGWDGMNVRISDDAGVTWQVLRNPNPAYSNQSLYSFGYIHGEGPGIPGWTGQLNNWTNVTFDLSSFTGETIQLQFAFASDGSSSTHSNPDWFGWQIDDIVVANAERTIYTNNGHDNSITAINKFHEATIISGNYRLRESGRGDGIATFNSLNQSNISLSIDYVDTDNNFTEANTQAGVSTHWAAEATYDYFLMKHSRNSYDDEGGRIIY